MGISHHPLTEIRLFVTADHPCGYLPGRTARNLVADPQTIDQGAYNQLARVGFRRSGDHVYRPHCPGCRACLSLRIAAWAFVPNRSQRRILKANADVAVKPEEPLFRADHYRLFERYLKARHRHGGMDDTSPHSYLSFINARWSSTALYEFRTPERLLAVAVTDHFDDGLSAVYTFFEPDTQRRSLGSYAILWQIQEARRRGLPWVYLGYWIRQCEKMNYKANYRPCEIFDGQRWRRLEA
ncbi:MAG: arginyltransferase [Candidatus Competibacterales bacterium]